MGFPRNSPWNRDFKCEQFIWEVKRVDERERQPIKDALPNQLPQRETELDLREDSGTQCGTHT